MKLLYFTLLVLTVGGCSQPKNCECDNEWLFYRIEKYEIRLAEGKITLDQFAMCMRDLERLDRMKQIKNKMECK